MCEVLIAGTGTAAIACALRLLQLGFSPVMISSGAEIPPGAEVIPEPVLPVLQELGLTAALASARAERRLGFENHLDARNAALLPGCWTHFERRDFIRFALDEALARGARLRHSRDIRSAVEQQRTGVVVDATGRSGILSQPVEQQGAEVASVFRIEGGTGDRARVFRSPSHWMYAIPFDTYTTAGIVGAPVDELPTFVRDCLRLDGAAVRIARRPAFAQRSVRPVDGNRIAIGDAAMAYSPLAGHGIRFAIQSALAAAAVVRTWRDAPEQTVLAQDYYEEFVKAAWRRHIAFLEGSSSTIPVTGGWAGPIRFKAQVRIAGVCREAQIVPEEAVQLRDGGLVRWLGGVDLLELRRFATVPIPASELVMRLSGLGLTHPQATQLVEWCLSRGVLG